jgi:hypothetical protein
MGQTKHSYTIVIGRKCGVIGRKCGFDSSSLVRNFRHHIMPSRHRAMPLPISEEGHFFGTLELGPLLSHVPATEDSCRAKPSWRWVHFTERKSDTASLLFASWFVCGSLKKSFAQYLYSKREEGSGKGRMMECFVLEVFGDRRFALPGVATA